MNVLPASIFGLWQSQIFRLSKWTSTDNFAIQDGKYNQSYLYGMRNWGKTKSCWQMTLLMSLLTIKVYGSNILCYYSYCFLWHIAYFISTFVGFPPYTSLFLVRSLLYTFGTLYSGCKAADEEVDEYLCKSGDFLIIVVVLDVFRICNCMIHWAMLNNEDGWCLQLASCTLIQEVWKKTIPFNRC